MVSSVADITQNVSFVEDVFLVPVFGSNWLKCILVLETASLWIVRVDPFKVHSRLLMACCSVERIGNAIEVTHRHASRILIQAQDEAQAVEWHQLLSQTTSQPSAPTDDVSAVPSFNHLPFDVSPSDLPSDVPTDEFDHDVYYMPKHSSQPPLDGDAHSPESEYSIPSENGTRAVAIPSTLSSFSKNNKIYANTPTRPPVLSKPPSLRAPPVGSIDTIPATLPLSKPKPKPVLVQKPDRKKSSASLSTTASSHVPKSPVLTTRSDSKMEPSPITPLPLRCPPLCREIEEKLKVDVNFAPFFVNKKEKEKVNTRKTFNGTLRTIKEGLVRSLTFSGKKPEHIRKKDGSVDSHSPRSSLGSDLIAPVEVLPPTPISPILQRVQKYGINPLSKTFDPKFVNSSLKRETATILSCSGFLEKSNTYEADDAGSNHSVVDSLPNVPNKYTFNQEDFERLKQRTTSSRASSTNNQSSLMITVSSMSKSVKTRQSIYENAEIFAKDTRRIEKAAIALPDPQIKSPLEYLLWVNSVLFSCDSVPLFPDAAEDEAFEIRLPPPPPHLEEITELETGLSTGVVLIEFLLRIVAKRIIEEAYLINPETVIQEKGKLELENCIILLFSHYRHLYIPKPDFRVQMAENLKIAWYEMGFFVDERLNNLNLHDHVFCGCWYKWRDRYRSYVQACEGSANSDQPFTSPSTSTNQPQIERMSKYYPSLSLWMKQGRYDALTDERETASGYLLSSRKGELVNRLVTKGVTMEDVYQGNTDKLLVLFSEVDRLFSMDGFE